MKIAVLVAGLRFDSQRRIINGILEKAVEDGTDTYIFSCDAWTYSSESFNQGETAIFSLPDFSDYDGIIFHGDTIYEQSVIDNVLNKIRESRVPCISLNVRHEDMLYVGMENASGIYEIVDHMIKVHRAKKVAFISGPAENYDAEGRLAAYQRALTDNGIAPDGRYVFYGDYHPDSGKEAVEYFYDMQGDFPDAIVSANDEMALGAFYELEEKGYDVPGQILLSGYDYAFVGRHHYPKITSVKRPESELGRRAYSMLKDKIDGKPVAEEPDLKCTPIFSDSCGCKDAEQRDEKRFRRKTVKNRLHAITYSEILKSSSADFTGVANFNDLLEQMKKYIAMIDPEELYICMRKDMHDFFIGHSDSIGQDEEDSEAATGYTPDVIIPLFYKKGAFGRHKKFSVDMLLPEELLNKGGGQFYTIVPLHYQQRCYGYCVLANSKLLMDSELFHLFIMNVNNAFESLRKKNMLNDMVQKLNRMWVYDTLTGVFNRAGFFKFAYDIITSARQGGENLFVLFLDLDGLKSINDKYGHDAGDNIIQTMGRIMNQTRRHGELLMRYGGDEFVVLAKNYTEAEAEQYMDQVRAGMENYNTMSKNPYTLDASMGYTLVEPTEDLDLEELIEMADKEMYKAKNEKKRLKELKK